MASPLLTQGDAAARPRQRRATGIALTLFGRIDLAATRRRVSLARVVCLTWTCRGSRF